MNELLEREGPATLVECPWCDGPVELVPGSSNLTCTDCRLALELALDRPTTGGWTKDADVTRSWRPDAAWRAWDSEPVPEILARPS